MIGIETAYLSGYGLTKVMKYIPSPFQIFFFSFQVNAIPNPDWKLVIPFY